ncbi:MAG: hypothetical protein AAGG38_13405, partial [Planctomycetota bacterium]
MFFATLAVLAGCGLGCDTSGAAGGGVEPEITETAAEAEARAEAEALRLGDRSVPERERLSRVAGARLDGPGAAQVAAALHGLVWSDRHAVTVRAAAAGRLIEADADGFWAAANRWLGAVDDRRMVGVLAERAVAGGRAETLPAWVRRWARGDGGGGEAERSEYRVVEALAAEGVEATLTGLVRTGDGRTAAAAWTVWYRWRGEAAVRATLAGWTEQDNAAGPERPDLTADA